MAVSSVTTNRHVTEHSHTVTLQASLQVPPPSLGHDMAQLLESGQAADVRFKVEEEELAAHKFILTARSPVFRSCSAMISTLVVAGTMSLILHRLPALWSWLNICCLGSFQVSGPLFVQLHLKWTDLVFSSYSSLTLFCVYCCCH